MVVILPYCIKAKRCEHNALGYWSVLALCLTKVRSSRARCPATALIVSLFLLEVDTLHVGRYWSEVLCCTIMTHLGNLEFKVTDFEILC